MRWLMWRMKAALSIVIYSPGILFVLGPCVNPSATCDTMKHLPLRQRNITFSSAGFYFAARIFMNSPQQLAIQCCGFVRFSGQPSIAIIALWWASHLRRIYFTLQVEPFQNIQSHESCEPLTIRWHFPDVNPLITGRNGIIKCAVVVFKIFHRKHATMFLNNVDYCLSNATFVETILSQWSQLLHRQEQEAVWEALRGPKRNLIAPLYISGENCQLRKRWLPDGQLANIVLCQSQVRARQNPSACLLGK